MRNLWIWALVALAGCATGPAGNGSIAIDTVSNGQPLPGASCLVTNGSGSWNLTTPASAPVGSPAGDLRVVCTRSGYRTSEVVYRPSGGGYGYGGPNVGVGVGGGGRVGVGLGLGFPIGGFGTPGYPSQITVEMHPQ
jgi:hypothetical protein